MAGDPVSGQGDFGAGIYRGREAPENAAYDLVNFLLDDEGQPYRRGGSAYRSTADAGFTALGLADFSLAGGLRTVLWGATASAALNDLNAPVALGAAVNDVPAVLKRPTTLAGTMMAIASANSGLVGYGGATSTTILSAGTVAVTTGSQMAFGTGTAWTAAEAGKMLVIGGYKAAIESVASAGTFTLAEPWPYPSFAAAAYTIDYLAIKDGGALLSIFHNWVAITTAGQRIVLCDRTRAYFSPPSQPWMFSDTDYHQMPAAANIIGAEGLGTTVLIFTTAGVWAINNMDYDAIDDVGNVQQTVNQVNELILWGDSGIAKWNGSTLVPAVDNVWLMPPGAAPVPIADAIRPLYLDYVKLGYQPGMAAVHRGHYFLPILNGTTWVDTLICRLDRNFAWTRWDGHGAGVAYAQRIGSTSRSPKLFSIKGQRVTDLTEAGGPVPSNASEADGSTHAIDLVTRDYPMPGKGKGSTATKLRLRYEATAAATPTVTAGYARGPEGTAFAPLSLARDTGGGLSDGLDWAGVWRVGKRAPAIRFRVQSASALSSFKLRELGVEYRQSD